MKTGQIIAHLLGESHKPVKKGDVVTFKPEWRDPGDEDVTFVALEDEDGGRVRVQAQLGLPLNPNSVVTTDMLE